MGCTRGIYWRVPPQPFRRKHETRRHPATAPIPRRRALNYERKTTLKGFRRTPGVETAIHILRTPNAVHAPQPQVARWIVSRASYKHIRSTIQRTYLDRNCAVFPRFLHLSFSASGPTEEGSGGVFLRCCRFRVLRQKRPLPPSTAGKKSDSRHARSIFLAAFDMKLRYSPLPSYIEGT